LILGVCQFDVSGNPDENMRCIENAIAEAKEKNVRILAFPECALTGYPPHDMKSAGDADFAECSLAFEKIGAAAVKDGMYIAVGSITERKGKLYNSAVVFSPDGGRYVYDKRALWGWDRDNFSAGREAGVFTVDGITVGLGICYEIRFPEYFRELYRLKTDLNLILFYDVSDADDIERYEIIKSHIRTRACENTVYTLSVNTASLYQTAPTMLCDRSGCVLFECARHETGLYVYDLEFGEESFSEKGRRCMSDGFVWGEDMRET